jgi:hypothetical protein
MKGSKREEEMETEAKTDRKVDTPHADLSGSKLSTL